MKNESPIVSVLKKLSCNWKSTIKCGQQEKLEDTMQKEDGGLRHSYRGIELAKHIVKYLEDIEGAAECFSCDEIRELREAFLL